MRISTTPRQSVDAATAQWMREVAQQVNALSDGRAVALYQAGSSAPTTGTFARGDFVANNTPSEMGTAGAKYVIDGWKCVSGGTPGTWVQCRYLTGG